EEGAAACKAPAPAGPGTPGASCQAFQAKGGASFVDAANDDYHLTGAGNDALIDHGNPAPPPSGATDLDGDPRAIDADGACPLAPIRDIGADEFNPGIPTCAPSGGGGQQASPGPTGPRAAALKKCRHKHGKIHRKCIRTAQRLPF